MPGAGFDYILWLWALPTGSTPADVLAARAASTAQTYDAVRPAPAPLVLLFSWVGGMGARMAGWWGNGQLPSAPSPTILMQEILDESQAAKTTNCESSRRVPALAYAYIYLPPVRNPSPHPPLDLHGQKALRQGCPFMDLKQHFIYPIMF